MSLDRLHESSVLDTASEQLSFAAPVEPETGHPIVSVIMAARDAASTVIQSIESILEQSFSGLELVVVDDGSRDETVQRITSVADQRLRLVSLPSPLGRSEARNQAIIHSRGRYIAVCDADDISLPYRIEQQLDFLESHDRVTVLGGQLRHFGLWGGPTSLAQFPTDPDAILDRFRHGHMAIAHPTAMFRRSVFVKIGLYFPECFRAQDLQLLLRTCGFGAFAALPDVVVHYRTNTRVPSWSYWRTSADYRRYAVYSATRHRVGLPARTYRSFSGRPGVRATRCLDWLRYLRQTVPQHAPSLARLE
jgi:glycosyltransferase involved in cell wall biosynthesis